MLLNLSPAVTSGEYGHPFQGSMLCRNLSGYGHPFQGSVLRWNSGEYRDSLREAMLRRNHS
ncbi:MAG: hypothetical protein HY917_03445 [Candidatus Diapherotrites archaeon]|nr:hypothetical protein [Candidatus Diapherotrites archaeon]